MAVFYPLIQHWLSIQYTLGMMKIFKKRKGKNKLCQHTKLRTVSCDQAILISGYIIKKNENICLCKNLQANTHSSIIHRQKWKQPKCPSTDNQQTYGIIIWWTIIQPQTASTDTTCNMDGPYSTLCWVKEAWHERVLYYFIHMKYPE